jgi:hypothetical protein
MKEKTSALFVDADGKCAHKNMEVDRKKNLKSSSIKYVYCPVILRESHKQK